ncbi:hypothetical protein [Silvibacterium dinghuense]|uniref:Uncharacterized protein n=1 Tax=Silvibacterium dinghuense TaxID=1560006 RepID=A0A4Q1SIM7_9BACT|nr:hypothetical protein [Silvibacterium dinghuense]RXS97249.1 hypothetical protein ESZ00_04875 [Silvibacterium dinghuense]GGG97459.1 hypothetical protein GCM10011586_10930 [Silvibacterium dinghuense]
MNSPSVPSARLELRAIPAPAPWEAVLMPVTEFPVPRFERETFATFLQALRQVLIRERTLHQSVFVQSWKLAPANGADILQDHLTEWNPALGVGIWPGREAPSGWTEEGMVNAAAAVFRGEEPALPSYRLLRLDASEPCSLAASAKLAGMSLLVEAFTRETIDTFFESTRHTFAERIRDRRWKKADFYLPLLDCRELDHQDAGANLQSALDGIDVYIRESAEDKGILIVARGGLSALMDRTSQILHAGSQQGLSL